MSRVFTDTDFLTWEAYASAGRYGLPERARIVFHCLSDPDRRARFVVHEGDEVDAEAAVAELPDERLRELLGGARELD